MIDGCEDQPAGGRFAGTEHRYPLRVYFEDTDAGGVVYHANYLRFMERARSDMLRCVGIHQREAIDGGIGYYTVAALAIRYRLPARLDDALLVVSQVIDVRAASCVIQQRVRRGQELVADADVTAAFLGPEGRPRRQPPGWIEAFRRVQADKGEE
jgi:acyl-CoA thioester hydrolase